MLSKLLLALLTTVGLSACYAGPTPDTSQDHMVGTPLTSISSMTDELGNDETSVALYDQTVNMIYVFDLTRENSQPVLINPIAPAGTHYVLFEPHGNYVIDFAKGHMTIFDGKGKMKGDYSFTGTPISASFQPANGFLIVMDDLHDINMYKLDSNGNILGYWPTGPRVNGDRSVAAADLNDAGQLVMGLSDNSIMLVDVNQSVAQKKYVSTSSFTTSLNDIQWIAPVHDMPNQVLIKSSGQISLADTNAGTILQSVTLAHHQVITKTSKIYDPNLMTTLDASNGPQTQIVYAQGSAIHQLNVYNDLHNLLSSRLNLTHDTWTVIDTNQTTLTVNWWYSSGTTTHIVYDDINATKSGRTLKRWAVDTQAALLMLPMPDAATLELTESHVFELVPSALGFAVNYNLVPGGAQMGPYKNYNKARLH